MSMDAGSQRSTVPPEDGRRQLRLPGTLAEVSAGPQGPQIGAFFDFDGTLIAGYSASAMAEDRLRRREIGLADLGRTARASVQVALGRADAGDFMTMTAAGWRGRSHEELEELGERLFLQRISSWVYPEARRLVAAHQERGHTVALTTSATWYQVAAVARELGIDNVLCTRLEVEDGVLTGNVTTLLWGPGKAQAVQEFAAARGVDLTSSYFYADGDEDAGLMHLVGKPRPTNPGRRLEQVARRRGWPIVRFSSRGHVGRTTQLRNAAGWVSAAPIVAAGLGTSALRGDRRAAVNLAVARWAGATFAAAGVQVRVCGKEHLAQRPAVFVVNHRCDLDLLVAASVVRKGYVALLPSDVAQNPLERALARLSGVLDPTDPASSKAAFDLVTRERLSLLAAPERIPTLSEHVGTFELTAFRLARELGVPVVPIVVRNAEDLGSRHARVIRPGNVEVKVLPPIPTERWTEQAVPDEADKIRGQFVRVLSEPPR